MCTCVSGPVLVREYQGKQHTATVVSGGYVWCETTYAILSTIERAITGTAWNGPPFLWAVHLRQPSAGRRD